MKLALRELRRRPGRFVTAAIILTLIAMLLMFLGGLLDGLIRVSTAAVKAQQADAIVYSETSQASFLRSRLDADTRADDRGDAGRHRGRRPGVSLLGARVPGQGPATWLRSRCWATRSRLRACPTSSRSPARRTPTRCCRPTASTSATRCSWARRVRRSRSSAGSTDTSYNGSGGLWTSLDTWRSVVADNRPDAVLADGVQQALVVRGDGSAAELVAAVDATLGDGGFALSIPDSINAIPGVKEQRGTFNQILGVTVVIALVVVALFFALITVERTGLYGVLKAIGARSGTIFLGLVTQAVVVTLVAAVIAGGAVVVLDLLIPPGSIPLYISPGRIVTSIVLMLVAAIVGSAFSLRRVLRIDPASALGSAG